MKKFFQAPPRLGNQYDDDRVLRSFLRRNIVGPVLAEIEPGLRRLGARAAGEMIGLALEAERASPALVQFDAWGRRPGGVAYFQLPDELGRDVTDGA